MHVIRPWLIIGSYREASDPGLLKQAGIGAVLEVAAPVELPGITSMYLPIRDGERFDNATLRRGVDFVLGQQRQRKTVMVACMAGVSRSTSFAIAALKEAEGLSLLEAATIVRRAHPNGLPNAALWASLCTHYNEQISYQTLMRIGN